jgi:hypothetical protein
VTDLSQLSDADLQALAAKQQAPSALSSMSDDQLQAAYTAAHPAPAMVTAPDGQQYDASNADELKHFGGMAARVGTKIVTALPFMAMDAGVGTRNALTGEHYTLPSADLNAAMDRYFGTPQGKIEKATDILGPMVGGAAATGLPGAARTLAGGAVPELGSSLGGTAGPLSEIPSSVLTPDQTKAQFTAQLLKRWQSEGGVVPPSASNPTAVNAIIESTAGKLKTQHEASAENADVANRLAARAVGLNEDAPLTAGALAAVRRQASAGYTAVRKVGNISTDDQYLQTLADVSDKYTQMASAFPGSKPSPILAEIDTLAQPNFPSGPAVDKISALRDAASAAYKAGDNMLGADYKTLATNLENQIDRAISSRPDVSPDVVKNFRASRQLIAKTHSVEDALTGPTDAPNVNAARLANSGDPLTGELKLIADMAKQAPKAMQDPNKIGSRVNHLDAYGSGMAALLAEHATGSPWGLAAAGILPAARWGANKYLFSNMGQAGAIPAAAASNGPMSARSAALAQALANFNQAPSSQ